MKSDNLTIKDLPLINRYGLCRWSIIDDTVKSEIGRVIKEALQDGNTKERLTAGSLALRIDSLNLKHEQTYIPKIDMDIKNISDEDLDKLLKQTIEQVKEIKDG